MNHLNSPILAALTLVAFLWLCHYSREHEQGYTHSVFEVLPITLKQRQAAILKDLWNISDNEINAPIKIFGE